MGTEKGCALAEYDFLNTCATSQAGLIGAGIHLIVLLKITGAACAVGKIAQGTAASSDCTGQCFFNSIYQAHALLAIKLTGGTQWR